MFCTGCGKQIADRAIICVHCSAPMITYTKYGRAQTVDIIKLLSYNT
ncbi:MAG: hypothetical protein K2J83_01270 [Clostridia bacterium]|nr:hypothetical protein [Clostridia bacterium]